MSNGQQILNNEEVEFLLDSSGNGPRQDASADKSNQQAVTMRGDLDQMPLGDVFQTLGLTKMEGVLRVCNPVEQRIVYFRGGNLRMVVPPRLLMRRLGQRLLQAGLLTADDLRSALTEQKRSPKGLDEVLVGNGYVSREQIDDIVALQVSEELFGLFTWTHGTFEFWKGPPQDEALQQRLENCHEFEVNSLLLEVARRSDEWEGILESLDNLDEVPVRTRQPEPRELTDAQRVVLDAADGKRTYRELADITVLSEFECARTAKGLVQLGLLERASASHMLQLAQTHLEQGHGKIALILAQAMCDRKDERTIEVSRSLASLLRGAGEPRLASAVLLESAQLQEDAETALKLAQEARALSPRDLATISFLRTTMLAHLRTGSPEIEEVTLDLLDGLLADGDVERLFGVVEETRQIGHYTPQVMIREARALAKKKERDAAVEVMLRAAAEFEQKGDRRQQLELLELASRLDRDRKDIQKQIQALRSTPRTRAMRIAAAAATAVALVGAGVVWWSGNSELQRVREESARIESMLARGEVKQAAAALTALTATCGDEESLGSLLKAVRAAESERAHAQMETMRKEASALLQQAGDLVTKGELAEAHAIYQRVRSNPDLASEADSAADARIESLQRDLTNAVVKLPDLLPQPPSDLLDRQRIEETLTMLQRSVQEPLRDAARAILRLRAADALPKTSDDKKLQALVEAAERAKPILERAVDLLHAYVAASQRTSEQRRLDPVFKQALQKERELDFAGALEIYRELASTQANTEGLEKHFRAKVTELEGILGVCAGLEAATKAGDHATARRDLAALEQSFPDVPFRSVVRLPVRLMTSTPGARVRWNGVDVGETPILQSYVPAATNVAEFSLDGFLPVRITLPDEHDGKLIATLTRKPEIESVLPAPIDQPMAATSERTFACDRDGAVLAVDNRTGKVAWRDAPEDATSARTAPQLYQGLVLTAGPDAPLLAHDQANGSVRWTRPDLATEVAPVPLDGRIAVRRNDHEVVLLDPRDGRDLGAWRLPARAASDLVGDAHTLLAALDDGSVAALDVKSMTTRWRSAAGAFGSTLTMTARGLVALGDDGATALIDLETGTARWRQQLRGTPIGRPSANQDAVAITFDEHVAVLALDDGHELLRIPSGRSAWTSAATMLGDRLAVRTRADETAVFSLDAPTAHYALASDRAESIVGDRRSFVLHAIGKRICVYRSMP